MRTKTAPTPIQGQPDQIMTAKEVAEMFKISLDQVYRLPLPSFRIGKSRVRYLRSELWAYAQRRSGQRAA